MNAIKYKLEHLDLEVKYCSLMGQFVFNLQVLVWLNLIFALIKA
jgi:hypothetical protein